MLWGISTLRTLCYSCVRVGAAALGALPCAAYTTLYAVWMPLSFVALPLRQSAMVFLPPFLEGAAKPPAELTGAWRRGRVWLLALATGSETGRSSSVLVGPYGRYEPYRPCDLSHLLSFLIVEFWGRAARMASGYIAHVSSSIANSRGP